MKYCKGCDSHKSHDDFYFTVAQGKWTVYNTLCKPCHRAAAKARKEANPEKYAESQRKSTRKFREKPGTKEKERFQRLRDKYGLSQEQYEAMHEAQNGSCAICLTPEAQAPRGLYVDHCHRTGKVRKLLCQHCNSAIGMLKEEPSLFLKAISYLEEHADE